MLPSTLRLSKWTLSQPSFPVDHWHLFVVSLQTHFVVGYQSAIN